MNKELFLRLEKCWFANLIRHRPLLELGPNGIGHTSNSLILCSRSYSNCLSLSNRDWLGYI